MNSLKGYQNYQHAEEASENQSKKNSIGISDVIHSMGAVFHIIQSFPKLSKSFNQKFSFDETNPFLSTKGQIISKSNVLFLPKRRPKIVHPSIPNYLLARFIEPGWSIRSSRRTCYNVEVPSKQYTGADF